ncbi:MAG: AAA family ATPase [Elusimicrobia bacterium]|nr:AAA family ATPase [Elusimicrobiota bacterium]
MIIAIAGKGGVGKSAVSSLIIKHLVENKKTPILAVDADPNSNLGYYLGIECKSAISDLRENEFKKNPSGVSKVDWIDLKIQESICETGKGFDLLVMGKPEGPGCYCAVNNLLRDFLKKINRQYAFVVIDNEAGMEHLSRRTNNEVDVLFIVAEPTAISFLAAENVKKTAETMSIKIKKKYLLVNKLHKEHKNQHKLDGLETIGNVKYNEKFFNDFENKKNIFNIDNQEIKKDIEDIMSKAGIL